MEENIKILNMWNEKVKTLGKLKLKEAQELFIEMKKESNIKEKELKRSRDAVIPMACIRQLRRRSMLRLSERARHLQPLHSRTSLTNLTRKPV